MYGFKVRNLGTNGKNSVYVVWDFFPIHNAAGIKELCQLSIFLNLYIMGSKVMPLCLKGLRGLRYLRVIHWAGSGFVVSAFLSV